MIRLANASDAQTIAQFQIAMAWETERKKLDPDTVQMAVNAVLDDPAKGFYLVNEIDHAVVGSLMITREWSDWRNTDIWYIQSVYVIPNARGQGVFRALYGEVMRRAELAGVKLVRLYVENENRRAQATYQSLGMKRLPYEMYQIVVPPSEESEFESISPSKAESTDATR